jgi:YD repeat-containing protein
MNLSRSTRIAFFCLIAFLLQTDRFMASAATAPPGACLYALDSTASRSFQIAGAQSVYTACGVVVESSASDGFEMEGSETLYLQNHAQVSVVGGAQLNGQTLWDTISNKKVQPVQVSSPGDPLASIAAPTTGTIVIKTPAYFDMNSKPANNTLSPGVYCGGLTIGNTNGTAFTMSPGVYIMAGGGLVFNSQAVVKGSGVTVYNTSSAGWGCSSSYNYKPVTISGQVTATLSAPTSGAFNGILFFGNRTGCSTKGSCVDQINGGSSAVLNGALYFASDEIAITGSNASGFMMLVADKIYINGNSTFGNNGNPFDGITVSVSPSTTTLFSGQTQQFTATVTNSANLAVTWTITPAGVGSISSTGLYTAPAIVAAQQIVTVTATSQADTSKSGIAAVTLAVAKTTPTITWATPAAITYGTALSATQLNATASVPGTFAYTPAAGTVLAAGSHTLSVTFTPTNTTIYNTAAASVPLTVNKALLTVTASNASRVYAAPNPTFTDTITGFVNGDTSSVVSGAPSLTTTATATSAPGSYPITATAGTLSAANYSFTFVNGTLTVTTTTQTISCTAPASPVTYGVSPITLSCTATSGLAVSFSVVSGPGTISSSTLTITGAGTVVVAANQAGNADYAAAPQVTESVVVNPAVLTVTASNASRVYAAPNPAFTDTISGFVNGDTSSVVSGAPSLTTTATATSAPGSYPITATAGTLSAANYSFTFVNGTLTVTTTTQTISCTAPASPVTYGVSPITLSCTATSGLAVSFSVVSGPGTISSSTLTITGAGTVVVAANQAGNADYAAAPQVTQSVVVNQAMPTITWPTPAPITYGTPLSATQLNASLSVAGSCIYTPVAGTVLSAGSRTLSVICTPTDTTDYATPAAVTVALTVTQAQCTSNGYSYQRAITIDHTQVPNMDQTNFPFMFNTTDQLLATTANGGHVTNPNGYDIIFTSDPAGQNILNYEMEEYNPVTGQVIAWVRIPTLSHMSDTVIYVFYGNSSIISSRQNPAGVWDANYLDVLHLDETTGTTVYDSTSNGNNGTKVSQSSPTALSTGKIGGSQSFNGTSDYIVLPPSMTSALTVFSVSFWTNSTDLTSNGTYWNRAEFLGDATYGAPSGDFGVNTNSGYLGEWSGMNSSGDNSLITIDLIDDGKWHRIDAVNNGSTIKLYLDNVDTGDNISSGLAMDSYGWYLGAQHVQGGNAASYHQGSLDEFRFSNSARSADWITAEYNNQSSPSTFYTIYPENAVAVVPATTNLYAGQSQQFTAAGACGAAIAWSMPSGAQGTLSTSGLYTAPTNITTLQTVTVTATNQATGTVIGSGIVTLMPPPTLTLAAAAQPPYVTGSSQGFVVILKDAIGTPQSGMAVTFTVTGVNNNLGIITTDSNGIASYAYIGSNSGSDTVQATAIVNGQQLTSNSVSVSWNSPVPTNAEGSVTLKAGVNLGLTGFCGAFTDGNGSVIEPIAIGTSPRVFVVPAGATQLQLGIVDDRYGDNYGSGFAVEVNGVMTTVLPTTMPWLWVAGGLNTNYKYGILDGTNPIVALTGLTQGAEVSIAYESGTVSAGGSWPYVNADGDPQLITGVNTGSTGTYFPTLYLFSSNYPVGQPIPITATVTNSSGTRLANVPVMLHISGANAQELETTTDSTGTASFTYIGINAGTDVLVAQAYLTGEADLVSSQTSVTWSAFTVLPPSGTLTLTPNTIQPLPAGGRQEFTVYAADAAGYAAANVKLEMAISGVDNIDLFGITDSTGHSSFTYQDVNPGVASVIISGLINGGIAYSNQVSVPWTLPAATITTTTTGSSVMSGSITALPTVTLPNTLSLTGTITDSNTTATITTAWSQVSGPGTVTFSAPQQLVTTAAFSQAGNYVLQLSASDSAGNSTSGTFSVTVNPVADTPQGWVGSPLNGSTVSGIVLITLASGVTLQSGTLTYYPANNPNNATVLNANTTGSGQIGTLDTTTLPNGSYWIHLEATNASGSLEYSLVLVTVAGNYKPGRVTATVTDLVVPSTGLAINIQRTYDSLNAGTSGDFGYGWNLGINVNLTVDNAGNVTFTLNGQRKTFYLAPQYGGWLFPYYFVAYTPEQGLHGTLSDVGSSCGLVFDMVVPDGNLWYCYGTGTQFSTTGYVYTDPNGTSYTISAAGNLQSIQDRSGNGLTITSSGITSTTGLSVPFVRDNKNRITQITDPQGHIYLYGYDTSGNLATVTYPNTTQPSTYTYDANHLYLSGTDARSNPLPTTSYFTSADTDPNGLPLNNRLKSVTDSFSNTTSYAYNLTTNTTTITYPDHGTATMVYDNYGMLLSSTDPLGHTTTNIYDTNHNLISTTDPLGHTTTSTYDGSGNKTSSTYPATQTSHNTTSTTQYNQYSEPISTTDELGSVRAFNYDANYNPQSVTDSIGTLASFIFNPNQTLAAGAIGYDISVNPAQASQFTYDASGNMTSRTDALGRTTSYVYNSLGQKTSMTTPTPANITGGPASTTTYTYDALGDLTHTDAPLSRITSSTYDANSNKISDTDARGYVTNYVYDPLNRLIETDYPDETKSTRTYDFRNNVLTATDQAGNVTLNAYDLAGRLTSVTRGYGSSTPSTTSYEYDDANHKVSETDALGHATSYTYDAAGRLVALSGVKGNFTYAYDDAGNRISSDRRPQQHHAIQIRHPQATHQNDQSRLHHHRQHLRRPRQSEPASPIRRARSCSTPTTPPTNSRLSSSSTILTRRTTPTSTATTRSAT